MKLVIWSAFAAFCSLPAHALAAPAPGRAAPAVAVGMAVVDDAGNPVGQVESVEGDDVLVRTDRHQARIPRSSFALNRGRLVMGMTRAQLNAAVERMTPAPPAQAATVQLAPGVTVRGTAGVVAGTIEAVEADYVTLRLTTGEGARLPRTSFGTDSEGAFISVTTEELRRLVEAASASGGN